MDLGLEAAVRHHGIHFVQGADHPDTLGLDVGTEDERFNLVASTNQKERIYL